MKVRLLADENTSHRLVAACRQIEASFPMQHLSDWKDGAYLSVKDPPLLMALREAEAILVGFDRASLPMHAGALTRRIGSRGSHPLSAFGVRNCVWQASAAAGEFLA